MNCGSLFFFQIKAFTGLEFIIAFMRYILSQCYKEQRRIQNPAKHVRWSVLRKYFTA